MDDFDFDLISSGGGAVTSVTRQILCRYEPLKEGRSSISPDRLLSAIYSRFIIHDSRPRMTVTAEMEFRVVRNKYEMLQLYRPYWLSWSAELVASG